MREFVIRLNLHGSQLLTTEQHPGPHQGRIREALLDEGDVVNALVTCKPFEVEIDLKLYAEGLCQATSRAWELAGQVTGSMKWTEIVTSVNSLALAA